MTAVGTALVDIDEIRDAARRIAGVVVRTPLLASPWPGLWLKPEMLQPIGAFKIRGAMTAMSRLSPQMRARGVLAHSSGNHAQAVAYAARAFGVPAHIVIPDNAPARKVEATRALGATVELVSVEQRFSRPAELAALTGKAMIAPYDDRNVIAGQGTIGLEIAEDLELMAVGMAGGLAGGVAGGLAGGMAGGLFSTVLVPVSGGGLISGVAAALAALAPEVKVIGVEPALAGDAADSFSADERRAWLPADTARTIADGLRTISVGELPWQHIRAQVHDIITVTEDEILDATRRLALEARLVAEPSGAVATAGFLHHRSQMPAGNAVAIVSGGNIDPEIFRMILEGSSVRD